MKKTVKSKYEAIFVLVNQGFTDVIMDAARNQGARGGTIMTTRAVGNVEAEKSYGIVITPNKELLIILVENKIKDNVIKAIYDVAGIETKATGIIWTAPVDNVIGLNKTNKK